MNEVEAINKSYDLLKEYLKAKGLKPARSEYELILKEPRQMNIYICWEKQEFFIKIFN